MNLFLTTNVDQLFTFDLNRVDIGANIEEPQYGQTHFR